jgi:hypothetical protein
VSLKRFVPLVLALALFGAAGCGDAVSPALRVGDQTFGYSDVEREFDEWAANPAVQEGMQGTAGTAPGSYSTQLTTEVLSFRILFELAKSEADRLDVEPVDPDAAREAFFPDPRFEAGFSDDYAESVVTDMAYAVALYDELGESGYREWLMRAFEEERIEVSSRYGRWDPDAQQIVPPAGPTTTVPPITAPPVPGGTELP